MAYAIIIILAICAGISAALSKERPRAIILCLWLAVVVISQITLMLKSTP